MRYEFVGLDQIPKTKYRGKNIKIIEDFLNTRKQAMKIPFKDKTSAKRKYASLQVTLQRFDYGVHVMIRGNDIYIVRGDI